MHSNQEQLLKKNQEIADLYREKSKKFTQITNLYNLLKSRAMKSQMETAVSGTVTQALDSMSSSRNSVPLPAPQPQPTPAPPRRPPAPPPTTTTSTSSQRVFIPNLPLTPSARFRNTHPVNQEGAEQLHSYQRSGTGSSRGVKRKMDMTAMPPPSRVIGNPKNGIKKGPITIILLVRTLLANYIILTMYIYQ